MKSALRSFLLVLFAAIVLIGASGCSRQAKIGRHMDKASRYLASEQFDQAEIELKNVLQLDPSHGPAMARLAIMYYDQGRVAAIYAMLSKAREMQPNDADVRLRLALVYLAAGKTTEAREEAAYVLERRPLDEQAPIILAETVRQASEIEEVRSRLQQLPPAASSNAAVAVALGLLDIRQRNFNGAKESFERAAKMNPKLSAAPFALGTLHAIQNNAAAAEEAFTRAASLAPLRSPHRIRAAQLLFQSGRAEVARKAMTELTQKAADYLPAWLLLAEIAVTEKRYDDSMAALGKILSRDPLHPEAVLLMGRVHLAKGETDKAIAVMERGAKAFPQAPQFQHQLGVAHAAAGDLAKAATAFNEALTLAPNAAGTVLQLAEINVRRGEVGLAVAALKPLSERHPEFIQARLLLAQAYRTQGNLADALKIYQGIATSFPGNPQAPALMGLVLLQQRKVTEARAAFLKALELDPAFLPALEPLVQVEVAQKNFTAARERVQALIDKQPKSAALYLLLARIHQTEAKTDEAEAALRKAIEAQPELPAPYFMLARLYMTGNQREKALENLKLAAAKNPNSIEPLMLMGVIYEQQKDTKGAREAYEKLLAINPRFSPALNNLAYLYSEYFNELDKAFEMGQRARDLMPREPHVADTLGWVLYKRGQYPWALNLLTESAEKLPLSAEVRFHLGMTYYMLGEEDLSRASLEQALKIAESFPGAEAARESLAILNISPSEPPADAQTALEKRVAQRPDPAAFSRLGALHARAERWDKAQAAYESALKASPNNIHAALGLIRVHRHNKQSAKALELAKATRKLAPADPIVAHTLGQMVLETGDFTWALSLLREAVQKQPENPDILFDLGLASYAVGQISGAETALRSALSASATFSRAPRARYMLEFMEMAAKPARNAATTGKIEEALKTDASDVPALMAKGAVAELDKDAAGAKAAYEKALLRHPSFSPAHRRLAVLYSRNETEFQKGLEHAAKARTDYPDDPEVAKAYGILTYRQKNYSRAQALLEESVRRNASDAEAAYYLGLVQFELKNAAGGSRSLSRALELGLTDPQAHEARRLLATAKETAPVSDK